MHIKEHLSVYKGLPRDMYALFVACIVSRIGSFIVPLMTLILVQKIGLSKSDAGMFSTIALLTQAPFVILGGRLADKIGGKKTIVIFNTLGALVYFVCGFLKANMTMAVLLVVASDLYAIAHPAFNCVVTSVTPQHQLKSAFSLTYLGVNLGFAVGPLISGLLFYKNLNLLFFLDGFTTLASTALILFFVRSSGIQEVRCTDGAAFDQKPAGNSVFSFLLQNPVLLLFALGFLVYNFCYVQWNFLLPLQMVELFSRDGARLFSTLVSVNAVTCIVLTPSLTSMTQKLHPLKTVYIGGFFYFASFLAFGIAQSFLHFLLSMVLMTVGEILISINTSSYVANRTPQLFIGRVNSIMFMVNGFGTAIGPGAMGKALTLVGFPHVWFIVAIVMFLGAIGMTFLKRFDRGSIAVSAPQLPPVEE